jgi:hypothetical protein
VGQGVWEYGATRAIVCAGNAGAGIRRDSGACGRAWALPYRPFSPLCSMNTRTLSGAQDCIGAWSRYGPRPRLRSLDAGEGPIHLYARACGCLPPACHRSGAVRALWATRRRSSSSWRPLGGLHCYDEGPPADAAQRLDLSGSTCWGRRRGERARHLKGLLSLQDKSKGRFWASGHLPRQGSVHSQLSAAFRPNPRTASYA